MALPLLRVTTSLASRIALVCYFTSSNLGGGAGPVKFGFNQSPCGMGNKTINVGTYGPHSASTTTPSIQILQAANRVRGDNPIAVIPYHLFSNIKNEARNQLIRSVHLSKYRGRGAIAPRLFCRLNCTRNFT